jgi:hypothetical protein
MSSPHTLAPPALPAGARRAKAGLPAEASAKAGLPAVALAKAGGPMRRTLSISTWIMIASPNVL